MTVTRTVTTKIVKPLPAGPQDGTSQDVKAMVQDMVKSSLTQLGIIPRETPTQLQSQSSSVDPESLQLVDTSEEEISNSDQEGPDSGTPELNQLVLTAEEQLSLDYDSFLAWLRLWGFAEETPPGSQTPPKSQTATTQAQPVTSTLAKPSGSQILTSAWAQPQAPAQAQTQPPARAQPPRLGPAYFPPSQAAPFLGAWRMPSESLHDEDRFSDFSESEASLIAKQARSELLDQVANFCELERGDPDDQRKVMGMNPPAYHDLARASINNNNNNNYYLFIYTG